MFNVQRFVPLLHSIVPNSGYPSQLPLFLPKRKSLPLLLLLQNEGTDWYLIYLQLRRLVFSLSPKGSPCPALAGMGGGAVMCRWGGYWRIGFMVILLLIIVRLPLEDGEGVWRAMRLVLVS